jgi:hypothetical protein
MEEMDKKVSIEDYRRAYEKFGIKLQDFFSKNKDNEKKGN